MKMTPGGRGVDSPAPAVQVLTSAEAIGETSRPRLAVVVPMYNEIAGAEACVRRIAAVLPTLPIGTTLIVVNDGSRDGTGSLLDRLAGELPQIRVLHKSNGGYGSALLSGAREAGASRHDYVLFMDSDLTNPPEHIARFVPAMLRGVDMIKGSRFESGGDMSAVPWRRRVFSVAGNWVASALFRVGVADCTNGFRAVRTEEFLRMPLRERGFALILEELYWAKKAHLTIASVPTTLTARSSEQRPSLFPYNPRLFWSYLRHALRAGLIGYHPHRP